MKMFLIMVALLLSVGSFISTYQAWTYPPDIKVERCECLTIISIGTHHSTDLSLVLDGKEVDSKSGALHLFSIPVGYNIQIYDGKSLIFEEVTP
jgi:hypothetical protein